VRRDRTPRGLENRQQLPSFMQILHVSSAIPSAGRYIDIK
jgi:hypothetical protein